MRGAKPGPSPVDDAAAAVPTPTPRPDRADLPGRPGARDRGARERGPTRRRKRGRARASGGPEPPPGPEPRGGAGARRGARPGACPPPPPSGARCDSAPPRTLARFERRGAPLAGRRAAAVGRGPGRRRAGPALLCADPPGRPPETPRRPVGLARRPRRSRREPYRGGPARVARRNFPLAQRRGRARLPRRLPHPLGLRDHPGGDLGRARRGPARRSPRGRRGPPQSPWPISKSRGCRGSTPSPKATGP